MSSTHRSLRTPPTGPVRRPTVARIPDEAVRRSAPVLIELAVFAALLATAMIGPGAVLVLLAVAVAAVIVLRRPEWSVPLVLILAFTELPAVVPSQFVVAGYTFYLFEPFLGIALVWSLLKYRAPAWGDLVVGALAVALVAWAAWGVIGGNALPHVVFDVRPLAHLVAAAAIGVRIAGTPIARASARLLPPILWFSTALLVLASATGFAISGSSEQATLYLDTATSDATRLRGPTTDLAMLVLCACIALFLMKRSNNRLLLSLAAPSFVIVVLAFSRYTVFGVLFAFCFAVAAAFSFRTVFRAVALAGTAVLLGIGLAVASPALSTIPVGDWVASQVSGFENRVIGGLNSKVIDADGSAQYRVLEDTNLVPQFLRAPAVGHGFGFAYKRPLPPAGSFFDKYGPYYAHNWYLWALVKTGVLGLTLLLGAILTPVLLALKRPSTSTAALAIAVGALMTCSFAAPMPNGDLTATLLGAALGLLVAQLTGRPGDYVLVSRRARGARARARADRRPSADRTRSTPSPSASGTSTPAAPSSR